jgi:hypothetical protein
MASPLLFLAYAGAKWFEKTQRDKKEEALAAKQKQEKEAEWAKERRVTEWGVHNDNPNGPIVESPIMNKENFIVKYRQFGSNKPEPVSPKDTSVRLFEDKNGFIASQEEHKARMMATNKSMILDDLDLRPAGIRKMQGTNIIDENLYTGFKFRGQDKPDAPKDKVIWSGDIDGKSVYGLNRGDLLKKHPKAQNVGQAKVPPAFIAGMNVSEEQIAALPEDYKSFAGPSVEKKQADKPKMFFGTVDGVEQSADSYAALSRLGATDIYSATLGVNKEGKSVKVGDIKFHDPKQKITDLTNSFVEVQLVDDAGNVSSTRIEEISYDTYKKKPESYKLIGNPYDKVPDGRGSYTRRDLGKISNATGAVNAGGARLALDRSQAVARFPEYTDINGKKQKKHISKGTNPEDALSIVRDIVRTDMPLDPRTGMVDFRAANLLAPRDQRSFMMAVADILTSNATVKDTDGNRVFSTDMLVRMSEEMKSFYPDLSKIPNLEAELKMRTSEDQRQAHNWIAYNNRTSPAGTQQVTVVQTVDVDAPAALVGSSPDGPPRPVTLNIAVPINQKYADTASLILSTAAPNSEIKINESGLIEVSGASEVEVKAAKDTLKTLVVYETDDNGNNIKGPNGQLVVSEVQPHLDFIDYLRTTKDAGGDPLYVAFRNEIASKDIGAVNPQVIDLIQQQFTAAVGDDYDAGHAIIKAFLPTNLGPRADAILYSRTYGVSIDEVLKKERTARIGEADSQAQTAQIISKMEETYFMPDGQPIDINSFMGDIYVAVDGAIYFAEQNVPFLKDFLDRGLAKSVGDSQGDSTLYNSLFGADNNGNPYYTSVLDLSDERIERLAKAAGKSVKKYREDELAAADENRANFEKYVKGTDSKDEKVRNLALRNYYRYMVAYSMAAAIQGGTGGRTISDQDVQNILRALKLNAPLGKASTELAILGAAKEMMLDLEKHNRMLGQGGANAYAALKLQQMTLGVTPGKFTSSYVAGRLGDFVKNAKAGDQPGTQPVGQNMDDAAKLKKINDNERKGGNPTFKTLEEAEKSLGKSGIALILNG